MKFKQNNAAVEIEVSYLDVVKIEKKYEDIIEVYKVHKVGLNDGCVVWRIRFFGHNLVHLQEILRELENE